MKEKKLNGRAALAATAIVAAVAAQPAGVRAQDIHGTLRGKYEYQAEDNEGRFEVRTARVSVSGKLLPVVDYKAEIDLCDEGSIKMLDAYAHFTPVQSSAFTIGQMRVPFTIDAHRSPHQQYFANRSFIAKQVGNVRDVGATVSYSPCKDVKIETGLFNGSGLTSQKDYWTKSVNFSAKAQFFLPVKSWECAAGKDFRGWNLTLSAQKVKPEDVTVMMYDAGIYMQAQHLHVEAEYLLKTYGHGTFGDVHAADAFACYDIPTRGKRLHKVSPLVRYDYMSDHSNGKRHADTGALGVDDCQRGRLTGGLTLSLGKACVSDIRINYENYFYRHDGTPKPSEKDKLVVEFMTHF